MAEYFDEPQPVVLADLMQRARVELRRDAPPMPGAVELLGLLRSRVYAVASNTPRELLDISLNGSGLAALVDIVVAGDEVPNGKPAPDAYLRACELLGVAPGDDRDRGFPHRGRRRAGGGTVGGDDSVRPQRPQ